jgi:tRNA modification GTPase
LIAPALATIKTLLHEIEETLAGRGRSERLRDGLMVAISGPPNVGKSTLINLLARREVAIVSPYAGTTRDVIEVQLDLDGYPVTLIDTAGIRDTEDPVEQEGVRRARLRAAESDLVLWVTDAEHEQSEKVGTSAATMWVVRNKIDLDSVGEPAGTGTAIQPGQGSQATFRISAGRGDGISELVAALAAFALDYFGTGEDGLIGRERPMDYAVVWLSPDKAMSWPRRSYGWRLRRWAVCSAESMSRTFSTRSSGNFASGSNEL